MKFLEEKVSKVTVNDYFSIAYYLTIFGLYEVSLIRKDAFFENSEFR